MLNSSPGYELGWYVIKYQFYQILVMKFNSYIVLCPGYRGAKRIRENGLSMYGTPVHRR